MWQEEAGDILFSLSQNLHEETKTKTFPDFLLAAYFLVILWPRPPIPSQPVGFTLL